MGQINTATRPFFCPSKRTGQAFIEDEIQFDWHSGMSWQVRQRSSDAMKAAILERYAMAGLKPSEILEVSTASHNYELGQALSAMNLIYTDSNTGESFPLENWFQAAKVFSKDGIDHGPFTELLHVKTAKRYVNPHLDRKTHEQMSEDPLFRSIQSEIEGAKMRCFKLSGKEYPLIPRSAFYDYLYVCSLAQPQNSELAKRLMPYRAFTDIMFNPGTGRNKRFNTQARSCAIYVALARRGVLDNGVPAFENFVNEVAYEPEGHSDQSQLCLFDAC